MKPVSRLEYRLIDFSDAAEIEQYAKQLEGHTFQEILDLDKAPEGVHRDYGSKRYKGGLGTLIEERYFGYKANSDPNADFAEAGLELKATCFDRLKSGDISAGERLVLTMVPFNEDIEDDLEESHLWDKLGNILLIYYERNRDIDSYDQRIAYVAVFEPKGTDLAIIEEDYRKIQSYVTSGRAHELSEGLTRYLGACTKGATLATMWVDQAYAPGVPAKRRAFCLKRSYMDAVLKSLAAESCGLGDDEEPIVKDASELAGRSFEEFVQGLIAPYVGKTDKEICKMLGLEYKGNKAQWTQISYHMLGISGDHAEEFDKGGVSVRTVRIEESGSVKESMSLTTFRFKDLVLEEWDDSPLRNYFEETSFFFVAFRKSSDDVVLAGTKFWSMPESDIEGGLRECWERTKRVINEGVELKAKVLSSGKVTYTNNLPAMADNPVAHVRPHASASAYRFSDGSEVGNVRRDADELPDGRAMTRQSFWLNSGYVYEIVSLI